MSISQYACDTRSHTLKLTLNRLPGANNVLESIAVSWPTANFVGMGSFSHFFRIFMQMKQISTFRTVAGIWISVQQTLISEEVTCALIDKDVEGARATLPRYLHRRKRQPKSTSTKYTK